MGRIVTATALFCVMTAVHAVEKTPPPIPPAPPGRPDVEARYLFYLHGRIVQEQGRKAVSPEYGRYEYDAILRGFAGAGFVVVSEVRPRRMNASVYADRVVRQIRRLLDARVPARSITVVGASMGGYIAMLVSSRVSDPHVGYAIMGLCGDDTLDLGDGLHVRSARPGTGSGSFGEAAPARGRSGGLRQPYGRP